MTPAIIANEILDDQWVYIGIEDDWHVWQRFDDEGDPYEERSLPVNDAPKNFVPTNDPPVDAWEADYREN